MKVSQRVLRGLSNLKGEGKIRDYENLAGGIVITCNDGLQIISRTLADLESNVAQIIWNEENN